MHRVHRIPVSPVRVCHVLCVCFLGHVCISVMSHLHSLSPCSSPCVSSLSLPRPLCVLVVSGSFVLLFVYPLLCVGFLFILTVSCPVFSVFGFASLVLLCLFIPAVFPCVSFSLIIPVCTLCVSFPLSLVGLSV